ncbi:hypothetical protein ACGFYY_04860 [Streptomyces sp. NPDC048331]|uniref:hypothetical protein n=1 Tax=Streptomyces sp. NPDC048331 TaxID=3365534 RepID=UPI003715566A
MDLTGWQVDATDGHIGEVDDQCDETGGAYLVVNAGAWISARYSSRQGRCRESTMTRTPCT